MSEKDKLIKLYYELCNAANSYNKTLTSLPID